MKPFRRPGLRSLLQAFAFILFSMLFPDSAELGAEPLYSVQDLGLLGCGAAMPSALNSSGTAVGFITNPQGSQVPVVFSQGTVTTLGGGDGFASGINSAGTIVGATASGVTEWSGGQTTSLHIPGYGLAINDAGQVAGAYQATTTAQHAFVYSSGKLQDLGTLGGNWSAANAINASGQVAGVSTLLNGDEHGFFWNGGWLTDIGTLGGANSVATGLNSHGEVVGAAQTSAGYMNAFSWTTGGMVDLGTLGGSASYAYGVNNSGEVVGYADTNNNSAVHGFVDLNGVMLDLNSLLPLSSPWTVTGAYAVDNAGDILGTATYQGQAYAVELSAASDADPNVVTPEPAALLLTGLGLVSVCCLRRWRRVGQHDCF